MADYFPTSTPVTSDLADLFVLPFQQFLNYFYFLLQIHFKPGCWLPNKKAQIGITLNRLIKLGGGVLHHCDFPFAEPLSVSLVDGFSPTGRVCLWSVSFLLKF